MKDKLTIISSCRMGPGTFEAKFIPLSMVDLVEKIIVIRKEKGPDVAKLSYCVLSKICRNSLLNMLITPFIIAKQVKKHRADLILAYHYVPHYYLAWFAAKIAKVPYILGQTGSDDQKLARQKVRGFFLRMVIKGALRLNVPGVSTQNFWKSLGFANVGILHSSIDTDFFVPSHCNKDFDYIYIGRLEDYKGVDLMIQATKEVVNIHPHLTFAIVGNGSGFERYKCLVKQLCLEENVFFPGFQIEVRNWLNKGRVFIMASDCEGLPCSLMEAMSCGMVCITSNIGNIGDVVINGETGFSFAPRDVGKLIELMTYTFEHEHELAELKKKAREIIVREHSYNKAISTWNHLLNEVL